MNSASSINRVLLIKVYIIVQILLINRIYSRLSMEEMKELQTMTINTKEGQKVIINEQGTGHPLGMYILRDIGAASNMRNYSSKVSMNFGIEIDKTHSKNPIYTYIRNCLEDTVLITQNSKSPTVQYLDDHYQTFCRMFPSLNGYFGIRTYKKDSFYGFLVNSRVRRKASYILAILQLLSEGMDIPISFTGDEFNQVLVIEKIGYKNGIAINMRMDDHINNSDNGTIYYTEAYEIINFFIRNRNNNIISKNAYTEPSTYEDFKNGYFLNSPQFLIKMYVSEYTKNAKEYYIIMKTIKNILVYYMESREECNNKHLARDLYNKYFIQVDDSSDNKAGLISIADEIRSIFNMKGLRPITFPLKYTPIRIFPDTSDNNTVDDWQAMDLSQESENITENPREFINYTETALLALFCRFTYDIHTDMHKTDKIPNPSKKLKWFFTRYRNMFEVTTRDIHNDWNKVVSDLIDTNIMYMRTDKQQLSSGLLNMLSVIMHISGVNDQEITNKFNEVQLLQSKSSRNLTKKMRNQVIKLINNVFSLISMDTDINVYVEDTADMYISDTSKTNKDIFISKLCIDYFGEVSTDSFYMAIKPSGIIIDTVPNTPQDNSELSNNQNYNNIQAAIDNLPESFIKSILLHYLNSACRQNYDSNWVKEQISMCKPISMELHLININRLFLMGDIRDIPYKQELLKAYSTDASIWKTPGKECITKFILNVCSSCYVTSRQELFDISKCDGAHNKSIE
ncbi:uncharacterized protein NEPG_01444 [Nematocida parisii ERTm1]|uniref:Uncharacterized protein n=1 Tax=Nematocida parisii (strain ERTm3) TaxID=935791 RepID=I3EFR5_NEMP3|nr:uncharacterized protein NEPG_01444 [Nematocida parisii ERTm1]EIJ88062.1 hypothetical protein NEQG_01506 [Nematocida parisii ERTm3]EIJ93872.1 hypothetical protein NEPG_01444 [Nematocida parisii ERTm1]KAI5145579.1 hypothetical protein NEPAR07_1785 [Nematocida parisii]KAI5158127.1 hypothetical protein NEPAR05_1892 [Nematocida parisii]|eukprot:XP_013059272.1 hypothetical protein NEPG_01444 [Nematocida parisii ERTm1]